MSRKDYVKLAAALALNKPGASDVLTYMWRKTVSDIADVLQADSCRFDRRRFLEACGAL